jgi:hypothetical protein
MWLARIASALLGLSLLVASAGPAIARCDPATDPDKSDIANARAAVAANCDCAGAASHGAYVSCAAQQVDATLVNRSCRGYVKKCAGHSTCGKKPGFVTCCRTKNGKTTCSIARDAASCTAKGGTAGACSSCCDACPAPGSGASCPATTSTVSVTTTTSAGGTQCCLRTVTCGPFDTCQVMTPSECVANGGFNVGAGDCSSPSACANATTTTPPFACCYGDNQCVNTGFCECGVLNGQIKFFQVCEQNPCVTTTTVP